MVFLERPLPNATKDRNLANWRGFFEERITLEFKSTSYITTRNRNIGQQVTTSHLVLFEEHSSSFEPYLFNGKEEVDPETNLSYYGARCLDVKISLSLPIDNKKKWLKESKDDKVIKAGKSPCIILYFSCIYFSFYIGLTRFMGN